MTANPYVLNITYTNGGSISGHDSIVSAILAAYRVIDNYFKADGCNFTLTHVEITMGYHKTPVMVFDLKGVHECKNIALSGRRADAGCGRFPRSMLERDLRAIRPSTRLGSLWKSSASRRARKPRRAARGFRALFASFGRNSNPSAFPDKK